MIDNCRCRLGPVEGEPEHLELGRPLADAPPITVPAITLEGDANGAPHPQPSSYAAKFQAAYAHRTVSGGVGHNLPKETSEAFAASR